MYIIFTEQNGMMYFWQGYGCFTMFIDKAKKYNTWEAADKACKRIKRWRMKFMSEEDYQEWLNETKN